MGTMQDRKKMNAEIRKRNRMLDGSNFGREFGWIVLLDGKPTVELCHPRSDEMFWESYEMKLLDPAWEFAHRMGDETFWAHEVWSHNPVFQNKKLGEIAEYGFPAGQFTHDGRLPVRGLYLMKGQTQHHPAIEWMIRLWRNDTWQSKLFKLTCIALAVVFCVVFLEFLENGF